MNDTIYKRNNVSCVPFVKVLNSIIKCESNVKRLKSITTHKA